MKISNYIATASTSTVCVAVLFQQHCFFGSEPAMTDSPPDGNDKMFIESTSTMGNMPCTKGSDFESSSTVTTTSLQQGQLTKSTRNEPFTCISIPTGTCHKAISMNSHRRVQPFLTCWIKFKKVSPERFRIRENPAQHTFRNNNHNNNNKNKKYTGKHNILWFLYIPIIWRYYNLYVASMLDATFSVAVEGTSYIFCGEGPRQTNNQNHGDRRLAFQGNQSSDNGHHILRL